MKTTPPGSPDGLRSPGDQHTPQLMDSPFSSDSVRRRSSMLLRSPTMRSPPPHLQSPRLQSPRLRSPPPLDRHEQEQEQKPRLIIRKLVLINYKSYAGRQEVGPFNEDFTAVVGPNGSGKSNVIDSLLFVFGFRAKKMRQDKLTGLIHKSEQHPNLQFARVEVHFETLGVPNSELVLAREVRRDGNNFYSLNDKRCSYAEVAELLEARGIDLRHKRFLILQGEVESIALMPPKAEHDGGDGLLEYLEDIIGTSNYKTRIEELDIEAETLKLDCTEKQRRVEIVAKDLGKLDAERAEIEKYMINQNRAIVARSHLYQLQAAKLRNTIALKSQDIAELEAKLHDIVQQQSAKREQLNTVDNTAANHAKQVHSIKQELKETTQKLKEAQVIQVKAKQRLDQLATRTRKAERNLAHARNERKQAEIWVQNFSGDSAALSQKLVDLNAAKQVEMAKLEKIQEELHESTKDLHDELESLQIQAEPWREKIGAKREEISSLDRQRQNCQTRLAALADSEQQVKKRAETIIADGHKAQKEVKILDRAYDKLVNEQQQLDTQITQASEDRSAAQSKLEQLRPEVAAAQEARTSSQNRSRLESELMRLKIPGLYGRLGSLGSISDKYDIAVSTAGPELNNFVVDTVETAKRCIEELRKRSLGRAKFMVLNKLKPVAGTTTNNNLPAERLVDLITPVDPIFMRAFASILGDTMVVATPEEATKVAFGGPKRHKVVTLGGMLVNSSGQMGGGGTPSRGLMAKSVSTVSTEDLESLEKQLAAAELDYVEARERLSGLHARKEELASELPRTMVAREKEHMSLKELESQMMQIKDQRRKIQAELKSQQESDAAAQQEYEQQKRQLESERAHLESQSSSIESAIQKLQEKILSAGGLRLREQKATVSSIQSDLAETQRRIEEGEKKVAEEKSRLKKLTGEIEKFEKELQECESHTDMSREEPVPDIAELEAISQRLGANLDHHTNELDAAKTEATNYRSEIEALRAAEIEAQNTVENLRNILQGDQTKYEELRARLGKLKLHDVSVARKLEVSNGTSADMPNEVSNEVSNESPHEVSNEVSNEAFDVKMEVDVDGGGDEEHSITELSPDELEDLNEKELMAIISSADESSKAGHVDMEALRRYHARHREYLERKSVGDQAVQSYEKVKDEVQRLKKRRYTEFMDGFLQISAKLKEMYQLITMGGNAELELVDTMDPFAEGILFSVMPPKKSWRNIANLSGGEKTLSSLALVFALHHFKPTPLYVMDEIDAALDFRNVSIIANYIKERTKNGQFIVISLRNNMFELASRLVGVYKVENMTKSVTLQIC